MPKVRANTLPAPRNGKSKAHSTVVGGSTAGLVRKCNASIIEARKAPAEGWKPWSAAGTALHTVVETAQREQLSNARVLREFTDVELESIIVTRDMLMQKVIPALEFMDRIIPETAKVHYEKKVSFPGLQHRNVLIIPAISGAFGTGDTFFSCTTSNRHGVVDFKMGDGVIVMPEDNDQGRFYLAAGISGGWLPVVPEYEFWIFQPAAKLTPDKYASKAIYTLDDLLDFAHDLEDAVTAKTRYVTGEHCKWCKGQLTCHAYQDFITLAVKTDIKGLSTHDLAKMRDMVPALEAFVATVKAAALRNAQDGLDVPGWKLEPTEGDRQWKDEKAALGAMGRLGVPLDMRQVKKTMSAPQALAWLRSNGTPENEVERFEKRHIVRPGNGEKLVKAKPGEANLGALSRLSKALAVRGI